MKNLIYNTWVIRLETVTTKPQVYLTVYLIVFHQSLNIHIFGIHTKLQATQLFTFYIMCYKYV